MAEQFTSPSNDPADHPPLLATKAGCGVTLLISAGVATGAMAGLHAALGWPWLMMMPVATIAVIALTLVIALHANLRHASAIGEYVGKQVVRKYREIETLSVHAARDKALAVLRDPAKCRTVTSPVSDMPILAQLGPELQRFFREFDSVEGPIFAMRSQIAPSEFAPGMIRIADLYGDGHTELVICPGNDAIYLLDLDEPDNEREPDLHARTIWHGVLMECDDEPEGDSR